MNILVTGGAGFIGSHIVDTYLAIGYKVIILDKDKTPFINKKATFIHKDILEADIDKIIKKFSIDIVNHHAAQISVPASLKDPLQDAQDNIFSTIKLIQAAKGVKKFINVSSAAVFDPHANLPIDEEGLKNPISPYGLSKLTAENYVHMLCTYYQIPYVTLRYANVFGPRQNNETGGVIAIFINKMKHQQPVHIFGDGNQTRDFVYVKDVARANVLAHELPDGTYNVGSGKEITINDMFKIAKKITNYQLNPIYEPPREGDLPRSVYSIKKIKKHGFSPQYSFMDGVKDLSQNM